MTGSTGGPKLLIVDACVLIDFLKTDRTVLRLVAEYVAPVHVASPIVDEVREIDGADELIALGIAVVEPAIEDAFAAAAGLGAVSFQDSICLLTAKRHGMTCVTNDKNLRRLCRAMRVPSLWGLEMLFELHKADGIPTHLAEEVAHAIHQSNPRHITEAILQRFLARLAQQ